MRTFTEDELERMQDTQEGAMQDTCQILTYDPSSTDDYGMPVEVWTLGDVVACGFDPSAREEINFGTEVAMTDAVLRLPIDTDITNHDRIKMLRRYDDDLEETDQEKYEILGNPERGPSGLVLNLRRITDGS